MNIHRDISGADSFRAKKTDRVEFYSSTNHLAPERRGHILDSIVTTDSIACGLDATRYWRNRPEFLDEINGLYLVWSGDELCAYFSVRFCYPHRGVLYLDSAAVHPSYRRKNWAMRLAGRAIVRMWIKSAFRTFYTVARTENPLVLDVLSRFVEVPSIYPCPRTSAHTAPADICRIARLVVSRTNPGCEFDESCFVIRSAFSPDGGFFYPQLPQAPAAATKFFVENVRASEGDCVLIVMRFDFKTMIRFLIKLLSLQARPMRRSSSRPNLE